MTRADQLRQWRRELCLSRQGAATLLKRSRRTIEAYESGARDVPDIVLDLAQWISKERGTYRAP